MPARSATLDGAARSKLTVRRIALYGVVIAVLLSEASVAVGQSGPAVSRRCSVARPYRVVASGADAVVSVRHYRDRGVRVARFRACWKPTGRITVLYRGYTTDSDEASAGHFAIAGPYVAWSVRLDSRYHDGLSFTEVANVKAGTHPHRSSGTVAIPGEMVIDTYIRSLAVTPRGTTAWIATGRTTEAVQARQLHHYARTLDSGPLGTLTNLGISRASVTWQRDGTAQSAFVPAG